MGIPFCIGGWAEQRFLFWLNRVSGCLRMMAGEDALREDREFDGKAVFRLPKNAPKRTP